MHDNGQKKRILIVDDSAVIRANLIKMLGDSYEVLASIDGFEALSVIESFSPNLILTDIKMEKLDGFEFVTLLRANPSYKSTPVIMLSSLSSVLDVAKGHLLGCNDYITKPVQAKILEDLLIKHLHSNLETSQPFSS